MSAVKSLSLWLLLKLNCHLLHGIFSHMSRGLGSNFRNHAGSRERKKKREHFARRMVAFRSSPNTLPQCTTTVCDCHLSQRPAMLYSVWLQAGQDQGICMCFPGLLANGFLTTFSCHLHTSLVIWVFEEADNECLVGSDVYSVALFASFPEAERVCLRA